MEKYPQDFSQPSQTSNTKTPGTRMGLFDNIFGKKVPPRGPASEAPVNETFELRDQNIKSQKLAESLQAEVVLVKSEEVIATPIQPVISEPSGQLSNHVTDSNFLDAASLRVSVQEHDELNFALRQKMEWVESELANADRKVAELHVVNALRQLLTERLLWDLQDSKLEIVRLCGEAIDLQRPASSVLPVGGPIAADVHLQGNDLGGGAEEELPEKLVLAALDRHELEIQIQHAKGVQERITLDEQQELIAKKVENATIGIKAQLTHVRGLLDAASAKLQDQEKLSQRVDAAEIENSALKKGVGTEVWALKYELECKTKEVASLNDQLGRRAFYDQAQAKRLAEREATINKNFAELQRRETELRDAKSAMAGCTPEVVSALREKIKNLQDQVSTSALASQRKLMWLQEQLKDSGASVQHLLAEKSELEKLLEIARRKNLLPSKRVKVSLGPNESLVSLSDRKIVDWMLEQASPEQAEVDHGYLSLLGDGPWSEDQLGLLMEQRGFSLWKLPDQDVRHVVLGRNNWDAEDLEEQIASVGDMGLRIYSQEMWFAKLITGRDPFDSGDQDLLMAFAKGHDALQYLVARDNPWPEVTSQDLLAGDDVFTEGTEFGATSPLHNFGYKVGTSSGLSERERRTILASFLEARSLSFDDQSSEDYRSHWGRPRSVQRLFRVASHIRWLIGWQGKSPFRAQANEEWIEDLGWLKKTFYKPSSHKFKWPAL
jgi:hypothetical protein